MGSDKVSLGTCLCYTSWGICDPSLKFKLCTMPITNLLKPQSHSEAVAPSLMCEQLKPRYHFSSMGEEYFARKPFRYSLEDNRVTRFIGMGGVKEKRYFVL